MIYINYIWLVGLRSFVIEQYIDDFVVNQQRDHFLTLLAQLPFAADQLLSQSIHQNLRLTNYKFNFKWT